jgi:predicted phage terminase large subunit-like protein
MALPLDKAAINALAPRARKELLYVLKREKFLRTTRKKHAEAGGLRHFVRYFWDTVEPNVPYVEGWALHAIFEHLEAVADGRITRLAINVAPGAMKSLACNVFFAAWLWACRDKHKRVLAFSYAAYLTERDNQRFLDLLRSPKFVEMYGRDITLREKGKIKISNTAKGWKFASSVGGVGTGERGDIIIVDDAHNIADGESKKIRETTNRWLVEAALNRLNNMTTGAVIIIGQRVHDNDVFGTIFDKQLGFVHLCIPMEYDPARHCTTSIGWTDPRTVEGECFFPERFPEPVVAACKKLGSFAWASQYQQSPEVREGGLLPRDCWMMWEPEDNKWPRFDYIVASLDPAFTSKESNDPSGFTVWGAFKHKGRRCVMLVQAWRKWLKLHGHEQVKLATETDDDFRQRCSPSWGLVEHVADACRRYKVDRLLIEPKASGITVAHEFVRLFPDATPCVLVDPGKLDKEARAIRVQPILENEQVYRPNRRFAELVVAECALFPRGEYCDLVDSATQALYWLRQHGYLQRDDEMRAEELRKASNYKVPPALYPAME